MFLSAALVLGACGPPQTLEQAIQCGQFKRLPDGTWSTAQDVSLDYQRNGIHYQSNFSKGVIISGNQPGEDAVVVAALDHKCGSKQ